MTPPQPVSAVDSILHRILRVFGCKILDLQIKAYETIRAEQGYGEIIIKVVRNKPARVSVRFDWEPEEKKEGKE